MEPWIGVAACAAVFIGAVSQRLAGIGFAMVAAPLLAAVLGPEEGVALGNALSILACGSVLVATARLPRWRRVLLLIASATAAMPLGVLLVRVSPAPLLTVLVGFVALFAVAIVAAGRELTILSGRGGAILSGAAAGFMNVTAGTGGPALVAHSASERWTHAQFVSTTQAVLVGINSISIAMKGLPHFSATLGIGAVVSLIAGVVAGSIAKQWVPERLGRTLCLIVAMVGCVIGIVRGFTAM